MKLNLSIGEVIVGVRHGKATDKPRMTTAWVKFTAAGGAAAVIERTARCSRMDNFGKAAGRKLVAERIRKAFGPVLLGMGSQKWQVKEDLHKVYAVICPEFFRQPPVKTINLVFDGPPDMSGTRLIEVEDQAGKSINIGQWIQRPDGLWALRIKLKPVRVERKAVKS